jgi:hypothetical protein
MSYVSLSAAPVFCTPCPPCLDTFSAQHDWRRNVSRIDAGGSPARVLGWTAALLAVAVVGKKLLDG